MNIDYYLIGVLIALVIVKSITYIADCIEKEKDMNRFRYDIYTTDRKFIGVDVSIDYIGDCKADVTKSFCSYMKTKYMLGFEVNTTSEKLNLLLKELDKSNSIIVNIKYDNKTYECYLCFSEIKLGIISKLRFVTINEHEHEYTNCVIRRY